MKSLWLHLLIAVAEGNRHGYAIRKTVEERTEGRIRLWPTTLYGTLRTLVEEGLLEEREELESKDQRQRRFYGLTREGRQALAAETRRLEELVRAARSSAAFRTDHSE